jgi:hypothetical protein
MKHTKVVAHERAAQMQLAMADEDNMLAVVAAKEVQRNAKSGRAGLDGDVAAAPASSIVKISMQSRISIMKAKAETTFDDYRKYGRGATERATALAASVSDGKESYDNIAMEITEKWKEAEAYSEEWVAHLNGLSDKVNAAGTDACLKEIKEEVETSAKARDQGAIKTFVAYVKHFNLTSGSIARKGQQAPRTQRITTAQPVSPLFTLVMNMSTSDYNMTASLYEAKGGVRGAFLCINENLDFKKVEDMPLYRKGCSKVAQAIKSGVSSCEQPLSGSKVTQKKFLDAMSCAVGSELQTKQALPRASWAQMVYCPQVFGSGDSYANVSFTPYGMMQCYLAMEGDISLIGLPIANVRGNTFKDKRDYLMSAQASVLEELRRDGGFQCTCRAGTGLQDQCIVVIPTGFVMIVAAKKCRAITWSLSADAADLARAKKTMQGMLDSFSSELTAPGTFYTDLAGHLGLRV